jgi:hypothetical protein
MDRPTRRSRTAFSIVPARRSATISEPTPARGGASATGVDIANTHRHSSISAKLVAFDEHFSILRAQVFFPKLFTGRGLRRFCAMVIGAQSGAEMLIETSFKTGIDPNVAG